MRYKATTGTRVVICGPDHELYARMGHVARITSSGRAVWVAMDEDLPVSHQSFPDPNDRRHRWLLVGIDDICQPAVPR